MPMSMYGELIVRPRTSPDCQVRQRKHELQGGTYYVASDHQDVRLALQTM